MGMGCGTFSRNLVEDRHTPVTTSKKLSTTTSSEIPPYTTINNLETSEPVDTLLKRRVSKQSSMRASKASILAPDLQPSSHHQQEVEEQSLTDNNDNNNQEDAYDFIPWPEDIMISLATKGSNFELREVSLLLPSDELNQKPLLKYVKDKRNNCQQNIVDCMYAVMSKVLNFGTNLPFPVNTENQFDVAIDFIANGCPIGKQNFTFFSHKEILLHRSAFFKGELSKDNGAVDSLKRTLSSAHDLRKSMVKAEIADRRNTAGDPSQLKRTASHMTNQGPRSSLPPMPSQKRPFNTTSSNNLLQGMGDLGRSDSSSSISSSSGSTIEEEGSGKEELFSSQGSLSTLLLTTDSRKKGQRKLNNQNLAVSISKQTKSNLQANRLEVVISPLVKNPEILLLVFENIYSGYFRPEYVQKMKSLDIESLIQILALGYQFKVHSLRAVSKSLISQFLCSNKDKYTSLEMLINGTCKNLNVEDIQKNNMSMVLELKKIFMDSKKSLQENFISLSQEKRTFLKDLDFMFVHSNMKKTHTDFSDMKLTIQVEEKNEEEEEEKEKEESPKKPSVRHSYEDDVQPLIRKKRPIKLQDSVDRSQTKKIFIHSFILKSRTDVSNSEMFNLFNTNVDVVKTFIHYLYTDTIHSDTYNITKKKIIPLAALFKIDRLKYECLAHAIFNLSDENILRKFKKAQDAKENLLSQAIFYTMAHMYPKLVQKNYEEGTPEYNILFSIDEKLRHLYQRMSGQFLIRRRIFTESRLAEIIPRPDIAKVSPSKKFPIHKINVQICGFHDTGLATFVNQAKSQITDLRSFEGVDNIELNISSMYISDRPFTANSLKSTDGVILLFSIDSVDSYQTMRSKYEDFRFYSKVPAVIIGNKCDLILCNFETEDKIVDSDRIVKEVSQDMACPYLEISAKNPSDVKRSLEECIREILFYRHITSNIPEHFLNTIARDQQGLEASCTISEE